jgi:hypothetical protein
LSSKPTLSEEVVVVIDEEGHTGIIGRDPRWFSNAIAAFFDNAPKVP